MAMRGFYTDSTVRKSSSKSSPAEPSAAAPPRAESGKHCAYNQTRERFLSADIDSADFSTSSVIDNRLPSLAPGAGLWLNPFMGISATSVRMPVDLIYLDPQQKVIDTVESFPLARGSAVPLDSISVLALPAETIRTTETQVGDQLMLCPPEEMKRRLQKLANQGSSQGSGQGSGQGSSQGAEARPEAKPDAGRNGGNNTGRVLHWEDRVRAKSTAEKASIEEQAAEAIAPEPQVITQPALAVYVPEVAGTSAEPAQASQGVEITLPAAMPEPKVAVPGKASAKPARGWLSKLLSPDPKDARKAAREALPGLNAFFFTGGAPQAHGVRDISLTGLYVLTSERWYPGTMVRMTLTDSTEKSRERSITLNTTVMRSGDDGVGLRFILEKGKSREPMDGMSYGASLEQIQEFLERMKSARQ
jgi:uncharacterized protein